MNKVIFLICGIVFASVASANDRDVILNSKEYQDIQAKQAAAQVILQCDDAQLISSVPNFSSMSRGTAIRIVSVGCSHYQGFNGVPGCGMGSATQLIAVLVDVTTDPGKTVTKLQSLTGIELSY
jgi:hypothetical protein